MSAQSFQSRTWGWRDAAGLGVDFSKAGSEKMSGLDCDREKSGGECSTAEAMVVAEGVRCRTKHVQSVCQWLTDKVSAEKRLEGWGGNKRMAINPASLYA